jgi:photosystem II stability/assembly factor-like uncharacterized protein
MRVTVRFTRLALAGVVTAALLGTLPAAAQQAGSGDPIFSHYTWRQVGPGNMSGRISDIAVPPGGERNTIYVAASAGGLWKTENNGTTWKQVFQGGKTAAVGDIGIAPSDAKRIYVGMGEPHSRNSVSWGDGVYVSRDAGETWTHVGLEDTGAIGRIAVDPRNPDVVYVAALGNQWKQEGDRGLYKSTNGGRTWTKLKGFDDGTGFYDVRIDPKTPDTVWATSWNRWRRPWVLESGGGPNNGIWKSTDAGRTWTRVEGSGLPPSESNGKISLEIFPGDPRVVYARIENFAEDPKAPKPEAQQQQTPPGGGGQFRGQRGPELLMGTWVTSNSGRSWERVDWRNGRPFYYCQLRVDPKDKDLIYLIDSSLYKLDTKASRKLIDTYPRPRGADDPAQTITGNHHVDFHAMWVDPTDSKHLIVGSDGGVSISWDQGATWDFLDNLLVGQFYAVSYDMAEPYHIYGGLQDNGTWGGPSRSLLGRTIQNREWFFYSGGDGFHTQVDPVDPDIILYCESQGGAATRINLRTNESQSIRPRVPRPLPANLSADQQQFMQRQMGGGSGGRGNVVNPPEEGVQLRFNWSTPIVLSPHNPRTVYIGGNYLFRSTDRGDTWQIISPDLTTNDEAKLSAQNRGDSNTGAENHCTIITIGESPLMPGVIWVGTDDGNVQVTRNGGTTWENVRSNIPGVPPTTWVSRVRPSAAAAGRAYVTFDGHRYGDNTTYVFVTEDYGQQWTKITGGLPADDPAYVITEDPVNHDLLYLGTESGVYASLDRGQKWVRFNNNLPVVPVHDLVVHSREHDLIIATHGLSLWIMDDVSGLQGLDAEARGKDIALLPIKPATAWNMKNEQVSQGDKVFYGENPPTGLKVNFWVGKAVDEIKLAITSVDGTLLREITEPGTAGLHALDVSLMPGRGGFGGAGGFGGGAGGRGAQGAAQAPRGANLPLPVGVYKLTLTAGDQTLTTTVEVKPDPRTVGR